MPSGKQKLYFNRKLELEIQKYNLSDSTFGIILNRKCSWMFLIKQIFRPSCSYKIFLIKDNEYISLMWTLWTQICTVNKSFQRYSFDREYITWNFRKVYSQTFWDIFQLLKNTVWKHAFLFCFLGCIWVIVRGNFSLCKKSLNWICDYCVVL